VTDFNDAYWGRQRALLDVSDDIRHVNFARFVADHCGSTIRYVRGVGWFKWTGRVWEETGDIGAAMQAVTDASRVLMRRASDNPSDTSWAAAAASKLLVHMVRKNVVSEMEVLPELHSDVDDMDGKRYLLTFQNGTVDLRTGEMREHRPSDMLTQCAPVDFKPDAPCPRFEKFVDEIFPGDIELQSYFQTFLGMCITGEVRDHALGVWYGEHGRNGKGATVRTMTSVFGKSIIREVPYTLWELNRSNGPHTEQIAGLRGARMVVSQEGNQGVAMNTSLLKNFSGGDRISARHLYGKEFTFDPTFTIVLTTNYLPEFSSGGAALWARTKAVLFGQSFADRVDIDLEPTIQGPEREGVAAWVVRGAVKYYDQGRLKDPLSVVQATEHHKDEVDPLKPLVGELFDYDPEHEVKRSAFNAELKQWRDDNGEKNQKFSPSAVKRHLMSNGVRETQRKGIGWVYQGLYLLSDPPKVNAGPGIFARNA
jgi:P4 family phage/plasmid primase-like protien